MKYSIYFLMYTLVTGVLYYQASHHPLYEPFVIHEHVFDTMIPMITQSVYIYLSYFFLLPVLILIARKKPGFSAVFYSAMACGLINVVIYNLIPTQLFEQAAAPEHSLLAYLQAKDSILCALPSGHVALPFSIALSTFMLSCQKRPTEARLFWRTLSISYFIWFFLLAGSTLLTKQHYLWDVLSGVVFASLIVCTAFYYLYAQGRKKTLNLRTVKALITECSLITLAMLLIITYWNPWTIILGVFFIASRQHALLALYHDAVHYLISSNKRLNDFIINCFSGVPFFMPVHVYRSVHFSHHQHLGTPYDPEQLYLYHKQPWNYQALNTASLLRQMLGDLLLWNSLMMLWFCITDRNKTTRLPVTKHYTELFFQFTLLILVIGSGLYYWPSITQKVLFLWFIPYLTVTQWLQKIRSFAEHTEADSCSWAPGWLGSFFIWPYNINYHKEHHQFSNVSWDELPQKFPHVEQRPGKTIKQHVWSV